MRGALRGQAGGTSKTGQGVRENAPERLAGECRAKVAPYTGAQPSSPSGCTLATMVAGKVQEHSAATALQLCVLGCALRTSDDDDEATVGGPFMKQQMRQQGHH